MIRVRFQYQKDDVMMLPINPENIRVNRSSASQKADVVGQGQIAVPKTPDLAEIQIDSFFWKQQLLGTTESDVFSQIDVGGSSRFRTAKEYADWFKTWQRLKRPARWTVESTEFTVGYDLWVICEAFNYDMKAGEEQDVYYELSLKEYRPYGAFLVEINRTDVESGVPISEPPTPERINNAPSTSQTYTVKSGDNLTAIVRRISPGGNGDWRDLYNIPENKIVIGDNPNLIRQGQVLIIPQGWVTI